MELCDIWRVKNLKKKQFTYSQRHNSDFIRRRLDYFLVSNTLQESIKKNESLTRVLNAPLEYLKLNAIQKLNLPFMQWCKER